MFEQLHSQELKNIHIPAMLTCVIIVRRAMLPYYNIKDQKTLLDQAVAM